MKSILSLFISCCLLLSFSLTHSQATVNLPYALDQEEELMEEEELLEEEEMLEEEEPEEEEMLEEEEPMEESEGGLQDPSLMPEPEEPDYDDETQIFEDVPRAEDERMRFFKETYELTFDEALFEDVWNSIKKSLEETNCMTIKETYSQNDEGFFKGNIKSDFCVFAEGDTTHENLEKYSIKVPFIRGGNWVTGRFQYKFLIKEQDDGTVYVKLKGEVSGFEDYVTGQVHFWDSNGFLETMMLRRIKKHVNEGDY